MKILKKQLPNGSSFDYIYIPSRVHDNQILLARDPEYINRLHMVGSPELVRAWLEGDFEIHEGSYFPEFSSKHIISPFNIPKHWPRYMGYDWGYRSPFAAVWGAVSSGRDDAGNEVPYQKGAIVIYREMWGKGVDNVDQANRIGAISVGENPLAFADPSIFNHEGGPSIADQFTQVFAKYKFPSFRAADNDRISGWSQIRQRLVANPPLLYIFATCPYLLETLPSLSIDKRNPEDADSTGNDHACFSGDTLVQTNIGWRKIKYLCKGTSVYVLSSDGQYHEARGAVTRTDAKVITLHFSDGTEVTCTPDHRFMLSDGARWKEARCLTQHDLIRCVTYEGENNQSDMSGVQQRTVLPLRPLLQFSTKVSNWIKETASGCMAVFQRVNTQRLSHSPQGCGSEQQSDRKFGIAGRQNSPIEPHDARAQKDGKARHDSTSNSNGEVLAWYRRRETMALGTRQECSSLDATNYKNVYFLRNRVSNQKAHGVEIAVLPPKLQDVGETKTVESISYPEATQEVYCLNVPNTGNFVLYNGVVVSNCDALRYLCKGRLVDAKWEQPAEVFNKGKIKLQAYIAQMRSQQKRAKI